MLMLYLPMFLIFTQTVLDLRRVKEAGYARTVAYLLEKCPHFLVLM